MGPERPVPVYREHREERHRYQADGEVGDREGEEKVVADGLELLVDLEADHDHGVADDCEHGEDGGDDRDDDLLGEAEGAFGEIGVELHVCEVG